MGADYGELGRGGGFQWRGPTGTRLLELWVRIPLCVWKSVSC